MRPRFAVLTVLVASLLGHFATTASAQKTKQAEPVRAWPDPVAADLLANYRGGRTDAAIATLLDLLAARDRRSANDAKMAMLLWVHAAETRSNTGAQPRRADLEALFLLCTEALFKTWPQRSLAPQDQNSIWEPLDFLHDTLKRMDAQSPFLRAWYLLWESFRQSQITYRWSGWPEYLNAGRSAFPDDAQMLLAAGSRKELEWWNLGIPRHLVGDVPNSVRERTTELLVEARKLLRRSVDADPRESEARLRLTHVLIELGEIDEARTILEKGEWGADEAAFEYLARLFEGAVNERRGNAAAALASYDRAIGLVEMSQSARLGKARILRASERRAEAIAAASDALTAKTSQLDPWWVFINGQAWRREVYLRAARAQVIR